MASTDYFEEGLYQVSIDPDSGNVSLCKETYINDNKREAFIFQKAYLMGREHKKSQILKTLGLSKS